MGKITIIISEKKTHRRNYIIKDIPQNPIIDIMLNINTHTQFQ